MNKTVNKFLLIIVETRKGANTDDIYIKETIKRFYPDIHNIIPKFIYMESKGAFKSSKLNHDIKEYVSYSNVVGIIQCIDLDNYDTSVTDKNLNDRIELHCKKKNYDFVWFCKNIEDVFYFNTSIEKNSNQQKGT